MPEVSCHSIQLSFTNLRLFAVTLYIVFYITLTRSYTLTVTTAQITPTIFKQLSLRHVETLSCPCTKIAVPHRSFVSHTIAFHPVCSSVFVGAPWIEGLYLINASDYGPSDFRTTARSQVRASRLTNVVKTLSFS